MNNKLQNYKGRRTLLILLGSGFIVIGVLGFFLGAGLGLIRLIFQIEGEFKIIIQDIIWYSAMPVVLGISLALIDFIFIVRVKRDNKKLENIPCNSKITVVLTAYNDEKSIAGAVLDFIKHPLVSKVIVISNNSTDATIEKAKSVGAVVFNEDIQGYGACVHRALKEGLNEISNDLICLCEGDQTFRAYDIDKLMAYIPHSDIVCGTRIVEQLQENRNQLSMFMHYGNFAVAKLLELKYAGEATLSDVGTTYKIIRRKALQILIDKLDPTINHEFNPYFIEMAIKNQISLIECPITFHPRVGVSKGANQSNFKSVIVGLRMIFGIFFGWKLLK